MRRLSQDAWVLIGLLLLLIGMAVLIGTSAKSTESAFELFPRRTSYSARPSGLRGLHDTLKKLRYPVRRHLKPLTESPGDGVLFVISPESYVSKDEWRSLRKWVEKGNVLVVHATDLDDFVPGTKPRISEHTPACSSFLSPDVTTVHVPELSALPDTEWSFGEQSGIVPSSPTSPPTVPKKPTTKPAPRPKASTSDARPLVPAFADSVHGESVGLSRFGKGWVVVLSSAWPISNQGIGKGDNLIMVLNAVNYRGLGRKHAVIFDEYHHGYGQIPGKWSLLNGPAKLGLAQVFLAFLVLVFAVSRRFGQPLILKENARPRSEYLNSMASLLRRARATSAVNLELERRFLDEISHILGLPPGLEADEVYREMRFRRPDKAETFRNLISPAGASPDDAADEGALLSLTRRRNRFRKELIGIK